MALIVQKFGGTSVANIDHIKNIVSLILKEKNQGNDVVVVVSAMAGVTNNIIKLCNEISNLDNENKLSEVDMALSTGEMVTASLTSLALMQQGVQAQSMLAWQLSITTNENFGNAIVTDLNSDHIISLLKKNIIPVISGFQGITSSSRMTTLGRGGSDTSAVLIAAKIKADRCDIYTDVDGIFTSDPRLVHNAKHIPIISFEDMLEFSSSGAKIMHPRSIQIAMRYNVNLRVLSSFSSNNNCTIITSGDQIMERKLITGITSNSNLLEVEIINTRISLNEIIAQIIKHNISIDFMMNNTKHDDFYNYKFLTSLTEKPKLEIILKNLQISNYETNSNVSLISIIGYGIKNEYEITNQILEQLIINNIDVKLAQIFDTKFFILVNELDNKKTISLLHDFLNLSK
jgi:aspartate kinase